MGTRPLPSPSDPHVPLHYAMTMIENSSSIVIGLCAMVQ